MASNNKAFARAFQHHESGNLEEAERLYQQILRKEPQNAEVLYLLGSLTSQRQQCLESLPFFEKAIALDSHQAKYYNNYGAVLKELGRLAEARTAFQKAIALNPNYSKALYNAGFLDNEMGNSEEAEAYFVRVVALEPKWAEALGFLGTILHNRGFSEQGLPYLEQALEIGCATRDSDLTILGNYGVCLQALGRNQEARRCYDQVLNEGPERPEAHLNLALLLLLEGEMKRGWEEYEWRLKTNHTVKREVTRPQWDGSPLAGRTLLVHAEQGYGDTFQFIRYLPLIERSGGRVLFECQPNTRRVLEQFCGFDELIERPQSNIPDNEAPHDVQIPLASLPHLFPSSLDNLPGQSPYLQAESERRKAWGHWTAKFCRALPGRALDSLKVGLVWAGNPNHKNDHNRSLRLADLAPLAQIPGVTLFSLQRGPAEQQAEDPPAGMPLINPANLLEDFAETAALLEHLDLLISVDTAVVHLAGAMGKPVWLMLPYAPDFRWLLEREDSPWYPTVRLFRQVKRQDWSSVIDSVAGALQMLAFSGSPLLREIQQAESLFQSGHIHDAKIHLQCLAENGMPHPRVYNNLGVIHWQEGCAAEALTAFLHALEIAPEDITTRTNCASVMRALGQEEDARALLGEPVFANAA